MPAVICLNMIVRNEVHIVHEVLDAVAPYIGYWVIVDTGSDDGTQDAIRDHMARLGIPGELHERPWHNFGHNRTEAYALAHGHGDYILIMDADDSIVGAPDFTALDADVYRVRQLDVNGDLGWIPTLFRDGVAVHWIGVTHEYPEWDNDCVLELLDGDYYVADRQISSRNASGQKLTNDRDLLQAQIDQYPEDSRSVFYLAQTYWCMGDYVNAKAWFARRIELGGWAEEVYFAMTRFAECLHSLGEPWPDIQDAYLRAWEYRPKRAEALFALASWARAEGRYLLGYTIAKLAAEIPLPETDTLFVRARVHDWCCRDEQAVCASWINKHVEAFTLWREILRRHDLPEVDRQRIALNRDVCVSVMLAAAAADPVSSFEQSESSGCDGSVTVTVVAGADPNRLRLTLDSFLNCCLDARRVSRVVVLDKGLARDDVATLQQRYPAVEFRLLDSGEGADVFDVAQSAVDTRFWLHLGSGAHFFAPENLISRLTSVLDNDADVSQVAVNYAGAVTLTGLSAPEPEVRRTPESARYVVGLAALPSCPVMYDVTRPGLSTATLDEVLCIAL